mgnify:CR=1 FL=1
MTLYRPTLFINRMIAVCRGKHVYDEVFRPGINIIRGENSSGKSTITDLLFYCLGGEISQWKNEASMVDYMTAEVTLGDTKVTLKRDIDKQKRPLEIYWGDYESSLDSAMEDWQKYPFQISDSKESFSQVLFRAMGMPEVRGDNSINITMHQIMRMIYVDQMTPVNRMIRFEQFDSSLHRETIGNLLCGVYSNDLYQKQLEIDIKNKEFNAIESKLKSIVMILGKAGQDINIEKLEIQLQTFESERKQKYRELEELKKQQDIGTYKKEDREVGGQIREELIKNKSELSQLIDYREMLEFEIADSQQFVSVIKERLGALKASETTRAALSDLTFDFCPVCLAEIHNDDLENNCPLCKTKKEDGAEKKNILRMHQELEMQVFESETLINNRKSELDKINLEIPGLNSKINELSLKYESSKRDVSSQYDKQTEELIHRIGYLDRTLENLHERARLLELIDELVEKKAELNKDISRLKDEIGSLKQELLNRKEAAYNEIANFTANLLKMDLDREAEFKFVNKISFNFGDDEVSVDGKRNFSASSMVYLKNSFHFAIFLASLNNEFFNYPRLIIFDNIEDKGMEIKRSHNFQRKIVEFSETNDVDHQIIFATSMVAEELEDEKYTVGRFYTHDKKSLQFG